MSACVTPCRSYQLPEDVEVSLPADYAVRTTMDEF